MDAVGLKRLKNEQDKTRSNGKVAQINLQATLQASD